MTALAQPQTTKSADHSSKIAPPRTRELFSLALSTDSADERQRLLRRP